MTILFEFQNSDVDDEHPEWRLHWVAGVALLHTIGHVLAKADALRSPAHKTEVDALWAEWKEVRDDNAIFWDFIEKERNNLLKIYTFGASPSDGRHGPMSDTQW